MHSLQREFADAGLGGTDKITHHGYHRFYPWFLQAFRGRPVRLLEIGIDQLGSVSLWRQYFQEGLELHGIDRDEKQAPDGNVHLHKVDQSDLIDLKRYAESVQAPFDIIVDDGSHVPEHQLLSLEILWPLVAPGGLYIIEDIETSYWGRSKIYGYRFDSRKWSGNVIDQLQAAIEAVNVEFLPHGLKRKLQKHRLRAVLDGVEMISFGQNCIILLKKDPASYGEYYGREYRLADCMMSRPVLPGSTSRLYRDGLGEFFRHALRSLFNW